MFVLVPRLEANEEKQVTLSQLMYATLGRQEAGEMSAARMTSEKTIRIHHWRRLVVKYFLHRTHGGSRKTSRSRYSFSSSFFRLSVQGLYVLSE